MTTPTIRAALDTFQQAANRGTAVYVSPELVQELRDALEAEPEEPATPSGYAYRYHNYSGGTYIKFNGGEEVNGSRPLEAVPYWFAPPSVPTAPPTPETPAEALAARHLLEQVARLGRLGLPTVGEIVTISNRAAAWLRENPPGQPVAIEPRGCPTPGACSCVEPAPPAPEPGEVGELVELLDGVADWVQYVCHADKVRRAATLLQQQAAELAALRRVAVSPALIVRFEFEVLDEHDQTVASGDASTLEEAAREGRHYLSKYQQDGPCKLELRRVEVFNSDAIPLPAPQAREAQRDAVLQAVAEALGSAYDCQRVWEAWNVGTMGPDDFTLTAEDDDRVAEIADAAIEAFLTFQAPAPQAGEVQPPRLTYLDAIRLAQGCHDYSGGHSGPLGEAFQDGVGTVVAVLKQAAVGPWDSQTMAVFGVGSAPQVGEGEA